jgi:glycosyltransferase involved in cell wall biosynthesis
MIRPRTPRRRPRATLRALGLLEQQLGGRVEVTTFGCDDDSLVEAGGTPGPGHLGPLTREAVGELMRHSDIFLDASAYQAFGRTGLEAMACGVVPVLPALGGTAEFARSGHDAVLITDDSPAAMAAVLAELAADRDRLTELAGNGVRSASRFTIERAARSQLDLFKAFTSR